MAKILIEPSKARNVLGQQDSLERTLKALSQDVDSVRNGLRYKIAGQENISKRLREAAEQITTESQRTLALRSGLEEIIVLYEQTETGNQDRVAAEKTSIQLGASVSTEIGSEFEFEKFEWDQLWIDEIANLVGPFGVLFTGGKKLLEKDGLGVLDEVVGTLGDIAGSIAGKPKADWAKEILGFDVADLKELGDVIDLSKLKNLDLKDVVDVDKMKGLNLWKNIEMVAGDQGKLFKNAKDQFMKELGDINPKTAGGAISWATAAVSSLLGNIDEFGEDSFKSGRFWGETIVETGINVAKDVAIAAAVGAGVVTVVGSAPALAVGAATVAATAVVDWGLNNAVKWATGGAQTDWTEALSDVVCDTGEKLFNWVGSIIPKKTDTQQNYNASNGWFSGCTWGSIAA